MVAVLMVDVRKVRMTVRQWLMGMRVRVGLATVPVKIVLMLVMSIVYVAMGVCDHLVGVQVLVAFGQVQPDAGSHQDRRQPEHQRRVIPERKYRDRCTHEWRSRKISSGARAAQPPQGKHEQHKTGAVTE